MDKPNGSRKTAAHDVMAYHRFSCSELDELSTGISFLGPYSLA
jgi:hypothetical protein